MRPSSPLSSGCKQNAASLSGMHFDPLQPPSPRQRHARTGNSSRKANHSSLKLPSLPRFHPANFPSANSSMQSTPEAMNSPQPPVSPRAHQRMLSDAQRQLFAYQREMVSAARAQSPGKGEKPVSPRLAPLGSPGPVTPLELGDEDGYLAAGARNSGQQHGGTPDELVERLIREEARHRQASSISGRPGGR
ncbi:hypothetical protein D0868_11294 [Hortaea werneckii]|uniref:Uncharacterized protein n=1 Tax=Hortaea werneckii TaxID=91943 RepID=A0A3M6XZM2_HORWE|nr:hypothetical protein D0868_11294 [Hortaea werneckii]